MPDLSQLLLMLALLLAIGAIAGMIAGLLGVGGGIILVPSFFYAFSFLGFGGPQLMQVCLGTSLATIIVTSVRSGLAHHRRGAVDLTVLRGWAPGIAIGAVLGVLLVAQLRTQALQAVFGVLALLVALYLGLGRSSWRLGNAMPKGGLRLALSPAVGFRSVLMGIGGGSFGVPLMSLFGMAIHRAVATAAGFGVVIAVPSVLGFLLMDISGAPPYSLGAINLPAFVVIIAMTLITAPYGARLAHDMDARPLRRIFAVFLGVVAINMLRKAFGG